MPGIAAGTFTAYADRVGACGASSRACAGASSKPDAMATSVGQRRWIREHVPGRTFADIGGMYQLMGDMAFLAEAAGATDVTLFDVGDPDLIAAGHPEWGWFEQKKADRNSKVRYVQGDLEDPVAVQELGPHDVVYYSGVLYHTPNPFRQLMHLREVTRELALIATITIPEVPGFDQACVFYPYLPDSERAPYARLVRPDRRPPCRRAAVRRPPDVRVRQLLVGDHPFGARRDAARRPLRGRGRAVDGGPPELHRAGGAAAPDRPLAPARRRTSASAVKPTRAGRTAAALRELVRGPARRGVTIGVAPSARAQLRTVGP